MRGLRGSPMSGIISFLPGWCQFVIMVLLPLTVWFKCWKDVPIQVMGPFSMERRRNWWKVNNFDFWVWFLPSISETKFNFWLWFWPLFLNFDFWFRFLSSISRLEFELLALICRMEFFVEMEFRIFWKSEQKKLGRQ